MYSDPTAEDIDRIARLWLAVSRLVSDQYGVELEARPDHLLWVQQLLDDDVAANDTQLCEAVGAVLGIVVADSVPGFDWCVYSDAEGRDLCLRYRETSLVLFPVDMVARRREAHEPIDLYDLFQLTRKRLEELSDEVPRVS